jgi:hypothetical protein
MNKLYYSYNIMKTKKRYNRKRVGRKTKRGGWGWSSFSSLFGKKQETPIQVRDWEGEEENEITPLVERRPVERRPVERRSVETTPFIAKAHDDRLLENNTSHKTIEDGMKLVMDYKANPSCLEYDTYVQAGSNDPTLKNYKRVLDIRLKNLSQNPTMKLFKDDIQGLQKCTSFFRFPFRTSKAGLKEATLERNKLLKESKLLEQEWKSPVAAAAAAAAGGKRKKNRKTKKSRKH